MANAGMGTDSHKFDASDRVGGVKVVRDAAVVSVGSCGRAGEVRAEGCSGATMGDGIPEVAAYPVDGVRRGTSFHRLMLEEFATAVKT